MAEGASYFDRGLDVAWGKVKVSSRIHGHLNTIFLVEYAGMAQTIKPFLVRTRWRGHVGSADYLPTYMISTDPTNISLHTSTVLVRKCSGLSL